jgi:hypothetical protein
MNMYIRDLVFNILQNILQNWRKHEWSLQGFGMLRTYITRETRLHVWNSKFAIPGVSMIHDHPWHLESCVLAGRITNKRYQVIHCRESEDQIAAVEGIISPYIKAQIVCGTGGGNQAAKLKTDGERVWLEPGLSEIYGPGEFYRQRADEVHYTSYEDGTVTLVRREFLPDTEHANVFFRADDGWVSAEPRPALQDEVQAFVERALLLF